MGGTGFLLHKKFHPSRIDNQKRVFVAEEKVKEKKRKEEDAAKEVLKEREASYFENLGQIQARDARNSSLKFMYSNPNAGVRSSSSSSSSSQSQEDPAVVAFWAKVNEKKKKATESAHSTEYVVGMINAESSGPSFQPGDLITSDTRYKKKDLMSHPLLKNAPIEGTYVKNMSTATFKPFSEKLRNVQCSLCGEWGHRFGDRECSMRDYNPHDQARLLREDPMTYFKEKLPEQKQRMILSEAASKKMVYDTAADEDGESDPEAEFLATLTPREKKLLLRKLQILQGEEVPPVLDSDDDSSTSSITDSDASDESESDHDGESGHHKKRKHKHHKDDKKSKHKHKHKHKKHKQHKHD